MTKQQEVKDTVRRLLQFMRDVPENDPIEDDVDWLLKCLHSQGVVIKVERELPESLRRVGYNFRKPSGYGEAQRDMLKAGYVATEPLIEEK